MFVFKFTYCLSSTIFLNFSKSSIVSIPTGILFTIAKISVDKMSFSLASMNFVKLDFDKNLTPRTYTNSRILPQRKFICFGFKNYNNTNSVLSSMSIIYSVPTQSYSGD